MVSGSFKVFSYNTYSKTILACIEVHLLTVNLFIFTAINFYVLPMECHFAAINFSRLTVFLICLISCNGSTKFSRRSISEKISAL